MDEDRFWALVDESLAGASSRRAQTRRLSRLLEMRSVDDIAAFERIFQSRMQEAYTWDLWGAAYIIHGGASDDGFEYFRLWLISRGRAAFESAVADADAIGDLIPADRQEALEFEDFAYAAAEAWKRKTGVDPMTADDGGGLYSADMFAARVGRPSGEPFEDDPALLAKRWPVLWARFGEAPLE